VNFLIIGFGNPYRGDDGFGMRAAEAFEATNRDPSVRVEAAQELRPEFAELASRVDLLLFLDASVEGAPGVIKVQPVLPDEAAEEWFSHELTPARLLAAARVLYGRCPQATMISVAGENFGFAEHLSPRVEAALPEVLQRMQEIIAAANSY
jgi:hydrogenase maturation protease